MSKPTSRPESLILNDIQLQSGIRRDETIHQTEDGALIIEEPEIHLDPSLLVSIFMLVQTIISTAAPAYVWCDKMQCFVMNSWYRQLKVRLDILLNAPYQKYDCCAEIRAFFRAVEELKFTPALMELPVNTPRLGVNPESSVTLAERVNQLMDMIRQEMKSPWAVELTRLRKKRATRQLKSMTRYVDSLFEQHSRLLVIRIDLLYLKEYSKDLSFEEFNAHLIRLADNQRTNKIFRHVLGSIIKLEYGAQSGFHAHCMFFVDGSKQQNHEFIAQQIGEYWVNQITRGKGRYENCNRSANRYRYSCIGQIEYHEIDKRNNLITCLEYFCKVEQCLLYMPLTGCHTMRRSQIKRQQQPRKGRKRNKPTATTRACSIRRRQRR